MKILLTGSTGQLGHALQTYLSDFAEIIAPTRAELDLNQLDSIGAYLDATKPDLIINPAAYTAVDLAEKEVALANRINALAPAILAQEAKRQNIGLIHFSTDYVFDGEKADQDGNRLAYVESDICAPLNVYGASKLAGEQAIIESGCKYLIFRTSWVYSDFGKNFLLTILRLAQEKTELNIVNDQFGTPTSTLFLSQICHKVLSQLHQTNDTKQWWQQHQGLYHLTPSGETNWCDFSREIVAGAKEIGLLKANLPTIHGIPSSAYPTPAQRPKNSHLNKDKFQAQFNIQLPHWKDALQQCIRHMHTRNA